MLRRISAILLASIIALSLFPLAYCPTVETRYFTSNVITYKGISIRTLETTPSITPEPKGVIDGKRFGIRVWKTDANDNETEITSGTPVATVIWIDDGWYSQTWGNPETALDPTDRIVVRVYSSKITPVSWQVIQQYVSETLGASKLDSATWTVYYYLLISGTSVSFWYGGTVAYNSRITGFTWTQATTKTWHSLAWNFNLSTRQWSGISWIFNTSAMQWNSVSWIMNMTGQEWHGIAWILDLPTMAWHSSLWAFYMDTLGWHSVYWVFTLGEISNIPVLFIGLAFFGCLALAIVGWRLKKRIRV